MAKPDPIAVGYFPKSITPTPDSWNGPENVLEIASVSCCISRGPEGWIERWQHNELGFFPTEDIARGFIESSTDNLALYAYRVFPLEFSDGSIRSWSVPVAEAPEPEDYRHLGYDIVSRSGDTLFECSPLSCNLAANEYPVNSHCLIEGRRDAREASITISAGNYEPGPYYLFEVFRKML